MSPRRVFRSRAGLTSAAAVLVVAGVLAGTMLANAAGPPLPKRTPAQLLVAMRDAKPPAAFAGVITQSSNLGFPSLPNIPGIQSSVLSGASLITGTHTADVWYDGPRHVRIALPVSFGETDLRVNGNQVWLWDSHGQTATHYILPALPALPGRQKLFRMVHPRLVLPPCFVRVRLHPVRPAKARAAIMKCIHGLKIGRQVPASFKPLTPQQAASKFLAAIGPTTKVSVAGSTVVAGRPAYQLVIAPRTNQSLISQIVIAVDSKTYLPLQLQVFARGTSGAAFQIGFTSLTFGTPAASNFTFTPPAGAHVKTEKLPAVMPGIMGPLSMGEIPAPLPGPFTSQRWLGGARMKIAIRAFSPRGQIRVVKGQVIFRHVRWVKVAQKIGKVPAPALISPPSPFGTVPGAAPGVRALGSGWLSVAVIQAGGPLSGLSRVPAKHPVVQRAPGSGQLFIPAGSAQGGQISALLRILLNSAAPVHGAWGSGRLLRTSLVSVLITSKGTVLIGAVTPDVLYADAAKVR